MEGSSTVARCGSGPTFSLRHLFQNREFRGLIGDQVCIGAVRAGSKRAPGCTTIRQPGHAMLSWPRARQRCRAGGGAAAHLGSASAHWLPHGDGAAATSGNGDQRQARATAVATGRAQSAAAAAQAGSSGCRSVMSSVGRSGFGASAGRRARTSSAFWDAAVQEWLERRGFKTLYIAPGSPWHLVSRSVWLCC